MSGGYYVQAQKLRAQSADWDSREGDVKSATAKVSPGVGMGEKFGYLAGANSVETYFNEWSEAMSQCLVDATESFRYISTALTVAANTYEGTDEAVAGGANRLKGRLG